MENVSRALLTGTIFHFAAGLITAGLWRLTAAHTYWMESHNHVNNPESKFWDIFSEVMIWPLYVVLLFSLFIKSAADLISGIINFVPRRRKKLPNGLGKEKT